MHRQATFAYRAAHLDGTVEVGVVDAATPAAAAARLVGLGLFPIEVTARGAARDRLPTLPVADVALGLRLLGDLLAAGLPMARALAAFEELAPPSWRAALPAMRESIREGGTLAGALASAPVGIPPVVIGIIGAGEAGSGIADAVRQAAEVVGEASALRTSLRNALAYPITLAVAGVASVGLLVGVVLPRFESILRDLGQALPPATQLLVSTAGLLRAVAPAGVVLLMLAAVLFRAWTATPEGRERWHEALLGVPLLGGLRASAATARSCAALAALLKSGVPIAPALHHATSAAGDAAIAARMRAARADTMRGERLSSALANHHAVTMTTVRLVRAGEETGDLASMLGHAARIERERAGELTRSAVRFLEPMLILVFGGLIALVAAALLQAIYSIRPGV
jgi:general secretion pathway protein F